VGAGEHERRYSVIPGAATAVTRNPVNNACCKYVKSSSLLIGTGIAASSLFFVTPRDDTFGLWALVFGNKKEALSGPFWNLEYLSTITLAKVDGI